MRFLMAFVFVGLALQTAAGQEAQWFGLRAGEVGVTKLEPKTDEYPGRGRVLDGLTGRPLAGVKIEGWTESYEQIAKRLVVLETRPDGGFMVPRTKTVGQVLEKLRFTHPGYCSTVTSRNEGLIYLYPEGRPFRTRVINTKGYPIAGARVRTHETCSHAPAAVQTISDEDGWIEMQLPFPEYTASLQVDAPGYLALQYVQVDRIRNADLLLAPQPPLRVQLLDAKDQPWAGQRLRLGASPDWAVAETNADGWALFDSLFDDYVTLNIVGSSEPSTWFAHGTELPLSGELCLRFSDWESQTKSVELGPTSDAVWKADSSVSLQLRTLDPSVEYVYVMTQGLSRRYKLGKEPLSVAVPKGVPVAVAGQGERLYRWSTPALAMDLPVTLDRGYPRVTPREERRELTLNLNFAGSTALELLNADDSQPTLTDEVRLRVRTALGSPKAQLLSGASPNAETQWGQLHYSIPSNELVELELNVKGFVPLIRRIPADSRNVSVDFIMIELAEVTVEGPWKDLFVAGEKLSDFGHCAVAPGPALLTARLDDQRAVEVWLELEPGESRVIRIEP